jgi:hypothetical protein
MSVRKYPTPNKPGWYWAMYNLDKWEPVYVANVRSLYLAVIIAGDSRRFPIETILEWGPECVMPDILMRPGTIEPCSARPGHVLSLGEQILGAYEYPADAVELPPQPKGPLSGERLGDDREG